MRAATDHGQPARIPCFCLIYSEPEIIEQSLRFLTEVEPPLEIIVLENPSERTKSTIEPFVMDLIDRGLVHKYFQFDSNIRTMAYQLALERELPRYSTRCPYVIVTDGDVTTADRGWLEEELGILSRNPDVFACALSVTTENLPLDVFPDAGEWLLPPIAKHEDYIEAATGLYLLLFRTGELAGFAEYASSHGFCFMDGDLRKYCYEVIGRRWARTLKAEGRHLTWDIYRDPDHPYTQLKKALLPRFRQFWYHGETADAWVYERGNSPRREVFSRQVV